jgi:hypothetical protein
VSEADKRSISAVEAARRLAAALDAISCEYALGGAIALGYWAEPRGTLDVDLTLFLPPKQPSQCVRLLQQVGCQLNANDCLNSLTEHGYCQVSIAGRRIDVFLPIVAFYEIARARRKCVPLGDQAIIIWDAESLCVFKMMFFRRKDLADVEQILRVQGGGLDRTWVREQLIAIYGERDPRITRWQELDSEISP